MKRIVVLGAGRVGRTIARDLSTDFAVTVADRDPTLLEPLVAAGMATVVADLADPATVARLAGEHDLVAGALPSFLGFAALEAVIGSGTPVVDISFFTEDPFRLDDLARERGVPAVVDCGVAPGVSNLFCGHAASAYERVDRFACYVGGLPVARHLPFEYKAPFAPYDVVEEYTRPARQRVAGREVVLTALSEIEPLDFAGVGTLEAFNTDGLRTLLATVPEIPELREKTLRYPGHATLMATLRELGLFDPEPMTVDGATVAPLAVTSRLLFRHWAFAPGEEDLTVMRIEIEGEDGGRRLHRRWDLHDRYDRATGTASMARTTGYACTAGVRLVASGRWSTPGIHPPEHLGRDAAVFRFLLDELAARGVRFTERDLAAEAEA